MNPKIADSVADLNQHWTVLPVTTQEDIVDALALYKLFDEYSGKINDMKIRSQSQKMQSHRHRYFLLKPRNNKGDNSAAGYYAADLQNPNYLGQVLLDQIFIRHDHRNCGLGAFLISHFLSLVAKLYYDAITTLKLTPKQVIVEHFRDQATPYPESLAAIRRTLKGFDFHDLPPKDIKCCPKSYLPVDERILDYQNLPFRA